MAENNDKIKKNSKIKSTKDTGKKSAKKSRKKSTSRIPKSGKKKIANPKVKKSTKQHKAKYNDMLAKVGKGELKKIEETDKEALERGDAPMSIVGHLDELRSRLIVSLITIIIVTLASFFLSEYILNTLTRPYIKTGLKLNVFTLIEGFMLRLKASLITGILVGLPVITYEIWKYIYPAINKNDRRFIRLSIIGAVLLMYCGFSFTYFLMLPIAIKMLLNFTPSDMNSIIGASQYLNFIILFSLGMGILFELPVIVMILTRINIITPELLISKRKYAIVLIWILAAILTPGPDVLSQALMAIPIMFLYEISIIISKFVIRRKLNNYG